MYWGEKTYKKTKSFWNRFSNMQETLNRVNIFVRTKSDGIQWTSIKQWASIRRILLFTSLLYSDNKIADKHYVGDVMEYIYKIDPIYIWLENGTLGICFSLHAVSSANIRNKTPMKEKVNANFLLLEPSFQWLFKIDSCLLRVACSIPLTQNKMYFE